MVDINVALDYPEYDIDFVTLPQVRERVKAVLVELDHVLKTASTGTKIKQGVSVVLAGEPNVGKSSILNQLVGYDRAIVTDIAGTTRDTVEGSFEYNGVRFNVIDTAGLRETSDTVERVGIERAEAEIRQADVVLSVVDSPNKTPEKIENNNIIKVLNKLDQHGKTLGDFDIAISAKTSENIEALKQLIFDRTINSAVMSESLILTNARHIEVLRRAKEKLEQVLQNDTNELECVSVLIMDAWNTLGEITGTTANEEIINAIFSKFCLGK